MQPALVRWDGEFIVIEHDDGARMLAVRPSEILAVSYYTDTVIVLLPYGMMREVYTGDMKDTAMSIVALCSQ
jgi:hypothetical protein